MKLSLQRRNDMHGASWPVDDVRPAPMAGGLVTTSVAMAYAHVVGAPCRSRNGSALAEIPTLFGTGHQALLAKGARRLKETST